MTQVSFVTGGTGFIGAALTKRLINEGHEVRVLRRDEMEKRYPAVDVRLPAVLKGSVSDLTLVLDAGEIRACRDLDELTDLLTYKLEHTGVMMNAR